MGSQQSTPPCAQPPPFSPPPTQLWPRDLSKSDAMEIDNRSDRSQRAASVLSGLSADDLEAAETLKSLQQDIHSPRLQQAPPNHVQTTSSFNGDEQEPLLSLITSQYPIAASVIQSSISVYKAAQQYTPGGEWTERHVGLPLARTTARISGVESVARWALQPRRDSRNGQPLTPDVEKAYVELGPDGVLRRAERGEQLPPYNAGDRSPPYSESQLVRRDQQPPKGWRQQLVITTSGLGVAMSDESIRSLKYCLGWLRWANSRLGGAVSRLQELLRQWERRVAPQSEQMPGSSLTTDEDESTLSAKIAAVKADVLATLRQVVNVVSTYAGGALPDNARNLVHEHIITLPQRFTIASRRSSDEENRDAATANANKALVLAQEGLNVMDQVTRVVNDTLVSAESWCERLGRRRGDEQPMPQFTEKPDSQERSEIMGGDADVKMEM